MLDLIDTATMTDWLVGRAPKHLSTNAGTSLPAFQAWRHFKEAFAPELIAQAFEETSKALGRPIQNCVDPFGGSGTTAIASQFLGVCPTTIEVNPYLADLIQAKLTSYNIESLLNDFDLLVDFIAAYDGPCMTLPPTFVEPGKNGRYIFSEKVANTLTAIRTAIESLNFEPHRRLFRVLLASICLDVSNVYVSGKGRRYRSNWENRKISPEQVTASFSRYFERAVYDIQRYRQRACLDFNLIRGDSRANFPRSSQFDVAIFSPPYPNSFDYTDVYNVELWVCGYLNSAAENKLLRNQTLRSHVQVARSYQVSDLKSDTLSLVYEQLKEVREKLWDRSIPEMVVAYFDDMNIIMRNLADTLVSGGRAYLVIGDSRYQGVYIPVSVVMSELAEKLGFRVVAEEPFRSMRSSPQQGGKQELLETLLTLELS